MSFITGVFCGISIFVSLFFVFSLDFVFPCLPPTGFPSSQILLAVVFLFYAIAKNSTVKRPIVWYHKKFDFAKTDLNKSLEILEGKIGGLLNESYTRAYPDV